MNFGIAYIQKKTIQKKFIYPLVFLLLLIPVLYFAKGNFADETGTDGSRIHSTSLTGQKTFSVKSAADVWYETGCSVREPERSVRQSSVTSSGLCIETVPVQFYQNEEREHIRKRHSERPPEPGRSNWSLRAPPVYVCNI